MIIWVKKDATDAACDQRARVDRVEGQRLYVTLLGSNEPAIVMPDEVCGIELSDSLTVLFDIRQVRFCN